MSNVDGCTREFLQKKDLVAHTESRHENGEGFPCDKCGHRYVSRETLTQHEYACVKGD